MKIYDIFGAGELVKEYLQVPGVVSSPIFLIPPEFLKVEMAYLHLDEKVMSSKILAELKI
jgi:hypothetical protein